jgi:hypothetical protein
LYHCENSAADGAARKKGGAFDNFVPEFLVDAQEGAVKFSTRSGKIFFLKNG